MSNIKIFGILIFKVKYPSKRQDLIININSACQYIESISHGLKQSIDDLYTYEIKAPSNSQSDNYFILPPSFESKSIVYRIDY